MVPDENPSAPILAQPSVLKRNTNINHSHLGGKGKEHRMGKLTASERSELEALKNRQESKRPNSPKFGIKSQANGEVVIKIGEANTKLEIRQLMESLGWTCHGIVPLL